MALRGHPVCRARVILKFCEASSKPQAADGAATECRPYEHAAS